MSKTERIEQLEEEVAELENELSELNAAVSQQREDLAELKFEIEDGAKGLLVNLIFAVPFWGLVGYAVSYFELF
ncbi:hypothetical protein [Salipiger mucosus]|uniref:Uncharacterized protein n=1 Tax=Salipiger mucosus DSM 16094 TaxID=1123237 RepID=S9S0V3_9RHOB|nr:hypothetical protein [Salipiger mucosus]EPX83870.1 hypothetical protein Salmuc_01645 [Salipiger mucosus DSM 16094]